MFNSDKLHHPDSESQIRLSIIEACIDSNKFHDLIQRYWRTRSHIATYCQAMVGTQYLPKSLSRVGLCSEDINMDDLRVEMTQQRRVDGTETSGYGVKLDFNYDGCAYSIESDSDTVCITANDGQNDPVVDIFSYKELPIVQLLQAIIRSTCSDEVVDFALSATNELSIDECIEEYMRILGDNGGTYEVKTSTPMIIDSHRAIYVVDSLNESYQDNNAMTTDDHQIPAGNTSALTIYIVLMPKSDVVQVFGYSCIDHESNPTFKPYIITTETISGQSLLNISSLLDQNRPNVKIIDPQDCGSFEVATQIIANALDQLLVNKP